LKGSFDLEQCRRKEKRAKFSVFLAFSAIFGYLNLFKVKAITLGTERQWACSLGRHAALQRLVLQRLA